MSASEASEQQANPFHGRVAGVDHITIPVHDLEAAERFYVGVLGAQVMMRITKEMIRATPHGPADERSVHTSVAFGQGPRIDLFVQPDGQPSAAQPHPHLAFAVRPEDLILLQEALEASGVPTEGPRRLGPPGQASVYFDDPSGNHLEITCMGFTGEVIPGPPDLTRLRAGRARARSAGETG